MTSYVKRSSALVTKCKSELLKCQLINSSALFAMCNNYLWGMTEKTVIKSFYSLMKSMFEAAFQLIWEGACCAFRRSVIKAKVEKKNFELKYYSQFVWVHHRHIKGHNKRNCRGRHLFSWLTFKILADWLTVRSCGQLWTAVSKRPAVGMCVRVSVQLWLLAWLILTICVYVVCVYVQLPADFSRLHLADGLHPQVTHVSSSHSGCSITSDSGSSSLSDIYQVRPPLTGVGSPAWTPLDG